VDVKDKQDLGVHHEKTTGNDTNQLGDSTGNHRIFCHFNHAIGTDVPGILWCFANHEVYGNRIKKQ
jgi:hypothetical protein